MKPHNMLRLARITRPFFRYRTPVIYRPLKWLVGWLCPPGRPGDSRQLVADFDGGLIQVDTASSLEYHILFRGCHEPEIVNLIRHLVRPGDVCLDIGANIGSHTLVMAQAAGSAGRVVALEPHPQVCERLRQNLALNRCAQVTVIQAALTDQDGTADFYGFSEGAFHQGISSLLPDPEATRKMQVRTVTGATLQREAGLSRCDFLKIDVEGVESVAMNELFALMESSRPALIFEYRRAHWEKFGHSIDAAMERLNALQYARYVIQKNATQPWTGPLPDSCEILAVPARA